MVSNCCGPVFTSAALGIEFTFINVVEYYNESLDNFFVSGSQPDIDALDSERIPGWRRANGGFSGSSIPIDYWNGALIRSVPVCRFYLPPGSHFFSASADECNALAMQSSGFVLETRAAFYAVLPNLFTGTCPTGAGGFGLGLDFYPVYRLWNNRADTKHRFTASLDDRAEMVEKDWISEGYGPMGVAMCYPYWY